MAIVTPVHNRREITLRCLRSLANTRKRGLEVTIYVVDDGSTDGTAEAIRAQHPGVRLILGDGALWYTEGTNVGVRRALADDPDYVLMINDDAVFDDRLLERLVHTAEAVPRSVVGALLLLWDAPHKVFQVSPRWEVLAGGWRHWRGQTAWTVPQRPWRVDLIVGNCLLVPVAAIRENGLMNSARYPNFGDAEYTPRLRRRGWNLLIEPRARAFCQPNNVPVRVRDLRLAEMLRVLFVDLGHVHNLRRRFYSCVDGGPSAVSGVLAFLVFFTRLLVGRNLEGDWGARQLEPPLKEVFAASVVDLSLETLPRAAP